MGQNYRQKLCPLCGMPIHSISSARKRKSIGFLLFDCLTPFIPLILLVTSSFLKRDNINFFPATIVRVDARYGLPGSKSDSTCLFPLVDETITFSQQLNMMLGSAKPLTFKRLTNMKVSLCFVSIINDEILSSIVSFYWITALGEISRSWTSSSCPTSETKIQTIRFVFQTGGNKGIYKLI